MMRQHAFNVKSVDRDSPQSLSLKFINQGIKINKYSINLTAENVIAPSPLGRNHIASILVSIHIGVLFVIDTIEWSKITIIT